MLGCFNDLTIPSEALATNTHVAVVYDRNEVNNIRSRLCACVSVGVLGGFVCWFCVTCLY